MVETSKNMFQKFKRNVLGVGQGAKEKTVDTKFETAKANWTKLNQITSDLRTFATNYLTNAKGLFSNGGLVSDTFNIIFINQPHPYTKVSNDHKAAMDTLNKDKARELEIRYEAGAGAKLGELVAKFATYKTRLDGREELRSKQDYYNAKVTKLRAERDKRLTSGKTAETAKDITTRENNERKLETARTAFEQENHALSDELSHLWDHRLDLFGPVMVEFMLIQSTVSRLLADTARVCDASLSGGVGAAKIQSWESLMSYTAENKSGQALIGHGHIRSNGEADSDDDEAPVHVSAAASKPHPTPIVSAAPQAIAVTGGTAAPPAAAVAAAPAVVMAPKRPPVPVSAAAPPATAPATPPQPVRAAVAAKQTGAPPPLPPTLPPALPTSGRLSVGAPPPPPPPATHARVPSSTAAPHPLPPVPTSHAPYHPPPSQAAQPFGDFDSVGGASAPPAYTATPAATAPPAAAGGSNPFDWGSEF